MKACSGKQRVVFALIMLLAMLPAVASGAFSQIPPVAPPQPVNYPAPAIYRLGNGLRYVVISRPDVPIVTIYAMIEAGAESDPPALPGMAEMVAGLLTEGTAHRSARQIAEAVDETGGSIDSGAGWDESYANISVLASYKEAAFDLLSAMLIHPAFAPQEIERARKQTLSGLRVAAQDPGYVADLALRQALFSGTAYGHSEDGTPESISHVTRRDLAAFHQRLYIPSRTLLAITGDISQEDAGQLVTRFFGEWADRTGSHGQESSDRGTLMPESSPVAPGLSGRQIIVIDKPDAVQTEIRAGFAGIARSSPDFDALDIANQILGGPAANRLFQALRTRRGLTYGASSELDCYRSTGSWVAKTSTRSAETIAALKIFLGQIGRLHSAGPAAYEMGAARNYLIGHQALDLESASQIANRELTLMLNQLPRDYWNEFPDRLKQLSRDQVAQAARKYLDPEKAVIVLVGNAAVFRKQLSGFGTVRVIPISTVE